MPSEPVVTSRPSAEVESRDEGVVYGGARGICSSNKQGAAAGRPRRELRRAEHCNDAAQAGSQERLLVRGSACTRRSTRRRESTRYHAEDGQGTACAGERCVDVWASRGCDCEGGAGSGTGAGRRAARLLHRSCNANSRMDAALLQRCAACRDGLPEAVEDALWEPAPPRHLTEDFLGRRHHGKRRALEDADEIVCRDQGVHIIGTCGLCPACSCSLLAAASSSRSSSSGGQLLGATGSSAPTSLAGGACRAGCGLVAIVLIDIIIRLRLLAFNIILCRPAVFVLVVGRRRRSSSSAGRLL